MPLTGEHVSSGRVVGTKGTPMNSKKALFVVMLGVVILPSIASAKPVTERHSVTPARRTLLSKLHLGR